MASSNPYSPPRASVADIGDTSGETQPVRIWSASGRVGRLRYMAYTMGALMLTGTAVNIAAAILAAARMDTRVVIGVALLLYLPYLVLMVLTQIQRSHDMGWSGWSGLLAIIPLVGLVWVFKAGTPGPNRFGAPPPPNTLGVKLLAWIFPAIVGIGMVAAVALPVYQGYVNRAKAAQGR